MKALFAFGVMAVLAVPVLASKEGSSRPPSALSNIDRTPESGQPMNGDGPVNPPSPAPTAADGPVNPPSPAPVADGPVNPPSPAPVADGRSRTSSEAV